ncbi:methylthioribulose 1-phosphate dehydratase [Emcibacter sp. SYSU 3D8]|uniref:methylthioribulose 1-phosphate dehydratase n=1 Tax=Emcibacter sp. SYSU 3D8 TaxID=3133969 RepID=UPI0031FE8243
MLDGMTLSYEQATDKLLDAGARFHSRGWVAATGGNLSHRLDDGSVAITISGRHKGELVGADIMRVDMDGASLDGKTPSAETPLHTGLYKVRPDVNAILHSHPRSSIVYGLVNGGAASVTLTGYEFLKVFPGIHTHEAAVTLAIFPNSQDMTALQRDVGRWYAANPASPAVYLVRGHGLTVGAATIDAARYTTEAVEELLAYELERSRWAR